VLRPGAGRTPTAKRVAKPAAKGIARKVPYFTYKRNVKLHAGQTLHYTRGRGYYAA
jgi:hypothetical protein